MTPTKTRGICGNCRESNPYSEINCLRCGTRLAWAFLLDGKKDSDFATPLDTFFNRLFGKIGTSTKREVLCRYCEQPIAVDEKVCPHCQNWLPSSGRTGRASALVDPDAPEIQRLLKLHRDRNP